MSNNFKNLGKNVNNFDARTQCYGDWVLLNSPDIPKSQTRLRFYDYFFFLRRQGIRDLESKCDLEGMHCSYYSIGACSTLILHSNTGDDVSLYLGVMGLGFKDLPYMDPADLIEYLTEYVHRENALITTYKMMENKAFQSGMNPGEEYLDEDLDEENEDLEEMNDDSQESKDTVEVSKEALGHLADVLTRAAKLIETLQKG